MDRIAINSPAKINIGLNIIEKRKDGFHNIETLFYPLLLSDKIIISKAELFKFDTNSNELDSSKENLIFKAVDLLEEFTGSKFKIQIILEKKIPTGAGLGGGSSNAASTLKALIKLYNIKITKEKLREIALNIGSDVPFFLNPVPCFAESRGEKITPIRLSIPNPILLVNPGIHISTKEAFENISPGASEKKIKSLTSNESVSISDLIKTCVNDFENYIIEEYPVIGEIKRKLYSGGAKLAMMTGTGSTVFGIFENLQKAKWVENDFKRDYFTYLNFPVTKGSIT